MLTPYYVAHFWGHQKALYNHTIQYKSSFVAAQLWQNARGPACGGYPAHSIPTPLDTLHAAEHHEPGPLPPLRAGTPPPPSGQDPPPLCISFGKGKGQGVPARDRVLAHGFLRLWAVLGVGPLSRLDPLLLLPMIWVQPWPHPHRASAHKAVLAVRHSSALQGAALPKVEMAEQPPVHEWLEGGCASLTVCLAFQPATPGTNWSETGEIHTWAPQQKLQNQI